MECMRFECTWEEGSAWFTSPPCNFSSRASNPWVHASFAFRWPTGPICLLPLMLNYVLSRCNHQPNWSRGTCGWDWIGANDNLIPNFDLVRRFSAEISSKTLKEVAAQRITKDPFLKEIRAHDKSSTGVCEKRKKKTEFVEIYGK